MGLRFDLVVVGGGTAGLVSSLIAAGAGARVALVEAERTGGDCLWTGCVPSKSLIAAGDLAQRIRESGRVGIDAGEPRVDFERVMAHVDAARQRIAPHDSPERLRRDGVEVIEERANFIGPGLISAGGREVRYRAAIIATGSRPDLPPIEGLAEARPLTTDTVWELHELPPRLVIIGGGPIGCELGQAFARLGSEVTLVEATDRLLAREEPEVGVLIEARLKAEGVDVRVGTQVTTVRTGDADPVALEVESAGRRGSIVGDRLLVATGRKPATAELGLEAVGVETDRIGAVLVDSRLCTTSRRIYATGDVTATLPFTHVAAYHARVASLNALFGLRRRVDYRAVPRVTFTDPEVAAVGLNEAEARERWGAKAKLAGFDYADLDRAITADRTIGFVKLIGDHRGKLVGATIAGPAAGESIAELAARVAAGDGIGTISTAVHAYPTFTETAARAADEYQRERFAKPATKALVRFVLLASRWGDRPGRGA